MKRNKRLGQGITIASKNKTVMIAERLESAKDETPVVFEIRGIEKMRKKK